MSKNEITDQVEILQARLIGVQDEDGYHLCTGYVKSVDADGVVEFKEEGEKILTYGAYEIAIQDLEICLAHVKAMRDSKIAERDADQAN